MYGLLVRIIENLFRVIDGYLLVCCFIVYGVGFVIIFVIGDVFFFFV